MGMRLNDRLSQGALTNLINIRLAGIIHVPSKNNAVNPRIFPFLNTIYLY